MNDTLSTGTALRVARDYMEAYGLPTGAINIALDFLEGTRPPGNYDELLKQLRRKERDYMDEDTLYSLDGLTNVLRNLAPVLKDLAQELKRYNDWRNDDDSEEDTSREAAFIDAPDD